MRRRPLRALIAAAAWALAGVAAADGGAPRAEWVGTYRWEGKSDRFGGFSGLELDETGAAFLAVTDRGAIVQGRLTRDGRGAVSAVTAAPPVRLLSRHGKPYPPHLADSEGLALLPGGGFAVSFETWDRISSYAGFGRVPLREDWIAVQVRFRANTGAEALAALPDGSLLFLPERPGEGKGDFPLLRLAGDTVTQVGRLRHDPGWSAVGADFGPDGRFYLLERDYWPLVGFRSRLRRITLAGEATSGFAVTEDIVLMETRAGRHDNLEGLAAWRDASGAVRLTMISDDNFSPFQRTELVDYRVAE